MPDVLIHNCQVLTMDPERRRLLQVRIEDGVATEIAPNFDAAEIHPAGGRACVKAFGLIQKAYNPNRILTPMRRTNPRKGRSEDPRFVPISWDEALDRIARLMKDDRDKNFVAKNSDGVTVNRWLTTGFLAASASNNEAAWATYKVVRSLGILAFDNQARV